MSTDTDEVTPLAEPDEGTPQRFARPGKTRAEQERLDRLTVEREDEPPADVPRDRYDQPIIVLPDGSGVLAYRRASKAGGIIEDTYGLTQWHKRTVAYGLSRNHGLVVRAQSVTSQTARPDIATLQDVADRAEIVAGADIGAMTGTGLHKLSERRDAGEDLSWLDPTSIAALDQYAYLMAPFEVLATEVFVIWDDGGFAGSLDRAVRLLVDLVWPDGVVIPAGTIVIIDIKTGKIKSAQYWGPGFSVQQLTYACGTPYFPGKTILANPDVRSVQNVVDVVEQPGQFGRVSWDEIGVPGGPSQRWALILHVPAFEPDKAKWERVDLDVAREDADVARQAWARHRVSRHERFLPLPAGAFDAAVSQLAIHGPAGTDDGIRGDVDSDVSTSSQDHFNPELHVILLERIYRADRIDMITQIYDAWGGSPSWGDEHADACEQMIERLTEPEDVETCDRCNYDRHNCPGCGITVPHGKDACRACELRLLISDADAETLIMYYEAHKPVADGGDGLWADEHTQAAQARYDELEASTVPGRPSAVVEEGDPVPADTTGPGFPYTDATGTLWCHECTIDEDPRPWCDCQPGEDCMDAAVSCRQRAHAPDQCPHAGTFTEAPADPATDDDEPTCDGCTPVWVDGALAHEIGCTVAGPACDTHGMHPGTLDCPECLTHEGPGAAPGSDGVPDDEPGPFDATLTLAELREAISGAESTAEVDALYEAHKPVADGGDGLWDDECTGRAQAVYDRLSPSEPLL
jgi:hypothetical protein